MSRSTFSGPVNSVAGFEINEVAITSSAAELNILDGVTSSTAELNILDGVTASAAEINLIDGSVAGTAVASKALSLGANKNVDVLVVADGGLYLGAGAGTAVGATAAELNDRNDDSAMTEIVSVAGAASVTKAETSLDSTAGTFALTLAAPTKPAMIKTIAMTVDNGDVTLALTNVISGSAATTATFSAVGQVLTLVSCLAASKWVVLDESGVVLT